MSFIMLAVLSQAFMGEYSSHEACQSAIRQIYVSQLGPTVRLSPPISRAIDLQVKYQNEYACIPKKVQ